MQKAASKSIHLAHGTAMAPSKDTEAENAVADPSLFEDIATVVDLEAKIGKSDPNNPAEAPKDSTTVRPPPEAKKQQRSHKRPRALPAQKTPQVNAASES